MPKNNIAQLLGERLLNDDDYYEEESHAFAFKKMKALNKKAVAANKAAKFERSVEKMIADSQASSDQASQALKAESGKYVDYGAQFNNSTFSANSALSDNSAQFNSAFQISENELQKLKKIAELLIEKNPSISKVSNEDLIKEIELLKKIEGLQEDQVQKSISKIKNGLSTPEEILYFEKELLKVQLQSLRERAISNISKFRGLTYWENMLTYIKNTEDRRVLNIICDCDFHNTERILNASPWQTKVVFYNRNHWLNQRLDRLNKNEKVNELFRFIIEKGAVDRAIIEEKATFKNLFLIFVEKVPDHIKEIFIKALDAAPSDIEDIYDVVYRLYDPNLLKETIKSITNIDMELPNKYFAIEAAAILLKDKDLTYKHNELLFLQSFSKLKETFINKHLFNDKSCVQIESILDLNFTSSHLIFDLNELTHSKECAIFHIEKIAKQCNLPYVLFIDKLKKDTLFLQNVSVQLLRRKADVERSLIIKSILDEFNNRSNFRDELIESSQRIAIFQAKEIIFSFLILQSPPATHAFLKSEVGQSLVLFALGVFLKDKGFDSLSSEMRVSALSNIGNSIIEEFCNSILKTIVPELSDNLDKIRILEEPSSLEESVDSIKERLNV